MNRYDNENVIIRDFQQIGFFDTILYPSYIKTMRIYRSIHNKRKWAQWTDSSSKKDLPPDFYNDKMKLMMDVMRVDDRTHIDSNGKVVNLWNKRESEILDELIRQNKSVKKIADEGNVFITPYIELDSEEDHNYKFYLEDFHRVLKKHINKIENYKCNHPGYKVIFFILDESTPYIRYVGKKKKPKIGESVYGEAHWWWLDKNMVNIIKDSSIDYLIWMAPFKYFITDKNIRLPKVIIYDVKKIKYLNLRSYPIDGMQSVEM